MIPPSAPRPSHIVRSTLDDAATKPAALDPEVDGKSEREMQRFLAANDALFGDAPKPLYAVPNGKRRGTQPMPSAPPGPKTPGKADLPTFEAMVEASLAGGQKPQPRRTTQVFAEKSDEKAGEGEPGPARPRRSLLQRLLGKSRK